MVRPMTPFRQCACGATYSPDEWCALPRDAVNSRDSSLRELRILRALPSALPSRRRRRGLRAGAAVHGLRKGRVIKAQAAATTGRLPLRPREELPGRVPPLDALSAREREVFELLVRRLSRAEIAMRLAIRANTVKSHTTAVYRKLGCSSSRELMRFAGARGLLPHPSAPGPSLGGFEGPDVVSRGGARPPTLSETLPVGGELVPSPPQ